MKESFSFYQIVRTIISFRKVSQDHDKYNAVLIRLGFNALSKLIDLHYLFSIKLGIVIFQLSTKSPYTLIVNLHPKAPQGGCGQKLGVKTADLISSQMMC